MMVVKTSEIFLSEVGFEFIFQNCRMFDVFKDLSIVKEDVASLPYDNGRWPIDVLRGPWNTAMRPSG